MASYIFILFIGGFAAMVLALVSIKIDSLIRPQDQATMIELSTLANILTAVMYFLWGLIVSLVAIISRSVVFSMIVALCFSIWTSWSTINDARKVYQSDVFDKLLFRADITQIAANFMIFPLTCYIVWRLSERYSN
jgi:hypothetical protein